MFPVNNCGLPLVGYCAQIDILQKLLEETMARNLVISLIQGAPDEVDASHYVRILSRVYEGSLCYSEKLLVEMDIYF